MNGRLCIAILSFNRPQYLSQVLLSLSEQYEDSIKDLDVYLFQDGAINPYSKIKYSEVEPIEECISLFKKYFPKGIVLYNEVNLGIALNFDSAEKYLFRKKGYEFVLFLEDDMVLRPNYISTINLMISKYGEDERVGMLAAYGFNSLNSLEKQRENKTKISNMHHNWAFCLSRKFWERRQVLMEEYLEIISNEDYRRRDDKKILEWHKKIGSNILQSSQDGAKQSATKFLKAIRITSFVNNAKYIGKTGVHMTEKMWIERNYDNQVLFDDDVIELEDLTDELYNKIINE